MVYELYGLAMASAIGSMLAIMALAGTRAQGASTTRVTLLAGLGLLSGIAMGPLLAMVASVDPAIPFKAFACTSAAFVCFHLAALRSTDRTFLYLGGVWEWKGKRGSGRKGRVHLSCSSFLGALTSMLMGLMILGLLNIFMRSSFLVSVRWGGGVEWVFLRSLILPIPSPLPQLQLYGGLLAFCGFVCYDTQLIVEKFRMGDNDAIWYVGTLVFGDNTGLILPPTPGTAWISSSTSWPSSSAS